jgi:hypothetical protein
MIVDSKPFEARSFQDLEDMGGGRLSLIKDGEGIRFNSLREILRGIQDNLLHR